jgi:hypothetical protein
VRTAQPEGTCHLTACRTTGASCSSQGATLTSIAPITHTQHRAATGHRATGHLIGDRPISEWGVASEGVCVDVDAVRLDSLTLWFGF